MDSNPHIFHVEIDPENCPFSYETPSSCRWHCNLLDRIHGWYNYCPVDIRATKNECPLNRGVLFVVKEEAKGGNDDK